MTVDCEQLAHWIDAEHLELGGGLELLLAAAFEHSRRMRQWALLRNRDHVLFWSGEAGVIGLPFTFTINDDREIRMDALRSANH